MNSKIIKHVRKSQGCSIYLAACASIPFSTLCFPHHEKQSRPAATEICHHKCRYINALTAMNHVGVSAIPFRKPVRFGKHRRLASQAPISFWTGVPATSCTKPGRRFPTNSTPNCNSGPPKIKTDTPTGKNDSLAWNRRSTVSLRLGDDWNEERLACLPA